MGHSVACLLSIVLLVFCPQPYLSHTDFQFLGNWFAGQSAGTEIFLAVLKPQYQLELRRRYEH